MFAKSPLLRGVMMLLVIQNKIQFFQLFSFEGQTYCAAVARFHLFRFADEHCLYIGDLLGYTVAHLGDCLLGGRFYIGNQFTQVLDLVLCASYLGTNLLTAFCVLVSSGGDLRIQIALSSFCRRMIFAASALIKRSSCERVFIVKTVFVGKMADRSALCRE